MQLEMRHPWFDLGKVQTSWETRQEMEGGTTTTRKSVAALIYKFVVA